MNVYIHIYCPYIHIYIDKGLKTAKSANPENSLTPREALQLSKSNYALGKSLAKWCGPAKDIPRGLPVSNGGGE